MVNYLFWSIITTFVVMTWTKNFQLSLAIKAFSPVIFKAYWYFNAYIVLFLFIPFLNAGFKLIDKKLTNQLIFGILLLSVTIGFLLNNLFEDSGYSSSWLMIMYLVGALIKKNENKLNLQHKFYLLIYFTVILQQHFYHCSVNISL